jgi:predicted small lipoprotein YifL
MQRRTALPSIFAIVAVAFALVACGVKSDLEAPPRANLTDSKTETSAAGPTTQVNAAATSNVKAGSKAATTKTSAGASAAAADTLAVQPESRALSERSVVQSKGYPSILPRLPPEEWQKYRAPESAEKAKPRSKSKDDTPFFLDPLL